MSIAIRITSTDVLVIFGSHIPMEMVIPTAAFGQKQTFASLVKLSIEDLAFHELSESRVKPSLAFIPYDPEIFLGAKVHHSLFQP